MRKSAGVDEAAVIEGVAVDGVSFAHKRRDGAQIGRVAGGEGEGAFGSEQRSELRVRLLVKDRVTADEG